MKKILLSILLGFCVSLSAQTIQQNTIEGSLRTFFRDVVELPDGYLMVGSFISPSFDSTGALLMKLDTALEVQWCKRFAYLDEDDFATITPLNDGNFLLGGRMTQNFTLEEGGSLIKVDANGNVIWSKLYDDSGDDRTIAAFEDGNNDLTLFIRLGVTGRATKIVRTDNFGVVTSQKFLESGDDEVKIEAIAYDGDSSYYCTGVLRNDIGINEIFILKLEGFNVAWAKAYPSNRTKHTAVDITLLNDGTIAVSGQINDSVNPDNLNYLMLHVNADGDVLQSIELDDNNGDRGGSIIGTADNGIVMNGFANVFSSIRTMAVKFDASGNVLWNTQFAIDSLVIPDQIVELNDRRLLMQGSKSNQDTYLITMDEDGNAACNSAPANFTVSNVAMVDSVLTFTSEIANVVGTDVIPIESNYTVSSNQLCDEEITTSIIDALSTSQFILYPNPVSDRITVNNPTTMKILVSLFNMEGMKVRSIELLPSQNTSIDLSNLPNGLYVMPEIQRRIVVSH